MAGQILTKTQLFELIRNNRFKIETDKPSLFLDELSILTKTAQEYGFKLDQEKTKKVIKEIFGDGKIILDPGKSYDGTLLQIQGNYSVKPEFALKTEEGFIKGTLFVFQESIINKMHKLLAEQLIKEKALELFPGCDEEYLYQAISDQTESYIYEILKKTSPGLAIYELKFDEDGTFTLKDLGYV